MAIALLTKLAWRGKKDVEIGWLAWNYEVAFI